MASPHRLQPALDAVVESQRSAGSRRLTWAACVASLHPHPLAWSRVTNDPFLRFRKKLYGPTVRLVGQMLHYCCMSDARGERRETERVSGRFRIEKRMSRLAGLVLAIDSLLVGTGSTCRYAGRLDQRHGIRRCALGVWQRTLERLAQQVSPKQRLGFAN